MNNNNTEKLPISSSTSIASSTGLAQARAKSLSPIRLSATTRLTHPSEPFIPVFIHYDDTHAYQRLLGQIFPDFACTLRIQFDTLEAGITNRLVRASLPGGKKYLIRLYGSGSELLIDRIAELVNLKMIAAFGLGSTVYGRFRNGLVYGYVEGHSLNALDLPIYAKLIAAKVGEWHARLPCHPASDPVLCRLLRKWFACLPSSFLDEESNISSSSSAANFVDFDYLEEAIEWVEQSLPFSPTVFCHNDLLGPNIVITESEVSIKNPTAPNSPTIQFIDFEYAGPNPRAFDLANHFIEWSGLDCDWSKLPNENQRSAFFQSYITNFTENQVTGIVAVPTVQELEREWKTWEPVPHLLWTLWALVQAQYSDIDFDYVSYGKRRYERLRQLLQLGFDSRK